MSFVHAWDISLKAVYSEFIEGLLYLQERANMLSLSKKPFYTAPFNSRDITSF